MSVSTAVATRDAAVAEVAQRPPLRTLARQAIERQALTLAKIMPQHMSPDRLQEVALAQIRATPKLLWCFQTTEGEVSLLFSIIQAAAAGLEIGGLSAEAYLIPYEKSYKDERDRWHKRWEARLQVSDRGVRDLARRDSRVKELVADVVREGDHFVNRRTLDGDVFEHEVRGPSSRPLTHAYCLIRWVGGGARAIVLDAEEVLSIRDRYSEGYRADLAKPADKQTNMWIVRPARAWAKTAIHQARRELDLTPEVEAVLAGATAPEEVPDETPWPTLDVELVPELGEARKPDPEPEPDPVEEPWDRPAPGPPPAGPDPDLITLDQLMAFGKIAGHWGGKTSLETARKRLVALAAEHCGATYETPEQLVADQPAAEQLLIVLQGQAGQEGQA